MKVISLDNLPDDFRVSIDEIFRKELFDSAVKIAGNNKKLAKMLGYERDISCLKKGYRYDKLKNKKYIRLLNVITLKKLSQITKIPIDQIESHIIGVKSCGSIINMKFPIYATRELASIIGHCFGDGHTSNRKCWYYNSSEKLIANVKNNLKIAFSTDSEFATKRDKLGVYRMFIPISIGSLLLLIGAPNGRKTFQKLQLPDWIKNGSNDVKSSFLRAIFDDEGCVSFRKGGKHSIIFGLTTNIDSKYLKEFLNSIRKILSDLGTESNGLCKERVASMPSTRNDKNVPKKINRIKIDFTITGRRNFLKFFQEIGFDHPSKRMKLQKIITSYKNFYYRHGECRELILNELKEGPRTTQYLMEKLNKSNDAVWYHLHELNKKNVIEKCGFRPVLWRLNNKNDTSVGDVNERKET